MDSINFITLASDYAISFQFLPAFGSADFVHFTNVGGTAWNNDNPTPVNVLFLDLFWPGPLITNGVLCPSESCTVALAALAAGTVQITTFFSHVDGQFRALSSLRRYAGR